MVRMEAAAQEGPVARRTQSTLDSLLFAVVIMLTTVLIQLASSKT